MSAWLALSVLLGATLCFSENSHAGSGAQFLMFGNNKLEASYYYQLQLTNNHTTILELRDGDVLASRGDLDATIKEVRQRAPQVENYKDVTQFDGNLVNAEDKLIGRLNCQFKSWTCKEDQAWVMKLAADADIVDRTYKGPLNPRFEIQKDDFPGPSVTYSFELRVKDSLLLNSLTQYPTVAAAKADIMAIQSGKYSFQARQVPVGPVGKMTIWVLAAEDREQALAQETFEMMALGQSQVQNWIQNFAPDAKIEEPTMHVLV